MAESQAWGETKNGVRFHSRGLGEMSDESRSALETIVDAAAREMDEEPTRSLDGAISMEEMVARVEATERARGERLRDAVIASLREDES